MSPGTISPLANVKALTFDVFGTVVDWRTSVVEELTLRAFRKRSSATISQDLKDRVAGFSDDDWGNFAQEWRDSYKTFVRAFNPERDAWKSIDDHHYDSLVELLRTHGLDGLYSESELASLSLVWHRLSPWPDTVGGLAALSAQGLVLATLSNGNLALLSDLNDFGALGFHKLLSAETFHVYKPNPMTYNGAARELGLDIGEVSMVATHLHDLAAARECGMRTVYVERPREQSWGEDEQRFKDAKEWVDLWVSGEENGFETVARRLKELS